LKYTEDERREYRDRVARQDAFGLTAALKKFNVKWWMAVVDVSTQSLSDRLVDVVNAVNKNY